VFSPRQPDRYDYFPAILCIVCESPIDALVALCVRRNEATELFAVARWNGDTGCMLATIHGGRHIAVMPTLDGRWAACNAFVDELFATPQEASRKLDTLLKRGRTGYVGYVQRTPNPQSPIPLVQPVVAQ
jgi:hypothetical protein